MSQKPEFILYTEQKTPRLDFISAFIFHRILGSEICLTTDHSEWNASTRKKINYSRSSQHDSFWIRPTGLAYESGIQTVNPQVSIVEGEPAFFLTEGGDFPFDIFSASFYLLSRYEEYLPAQIDGYGRFDHRSSIAWRNGFLDKPLIDVWVLHLRKALKLKFPNIEFPPQPFSFIPTYDIDIAWAHLHRSAARSFLGMAASLFKGRFADMISQVLTIAGRAGDAYDIYAWLDGIHRQFRFSPIYFFLVSDKWGWYDRNIDPENPAMQHLIRATHEKYHVGLHPSWRSVDDIRILQAEYRRLSSLASLRKISQSRQHYLRFHLPQTYRALIQVGITDDYSMGYGCVNGFRASTNYPFPWYDLLEEQETDLHLHPFCFMDATAYHELNMEPEQAYASMQEYLRVSAITGGESVFIFHNSTLGSSRMYAGWREIYAQFLASMHTMGL